jgi:ankyrin repeat protein
MNYYSQNKFYELIRFGNLKCLQEYYEYHKKRIDVSAENEQAFSYACEFGHLDIAKWLLEIKPDIDVSAENEYAFRYACKNNHYDIQDWLLDIREEGIITYQN